MTTRVLVIFPDADASQVERFRIRWDPLASLVLAHITIVFPFEWPGSTSELQAVLTGTVARQSAFSVRLTQPTIWEDEYLFLLVTEGRDDVQRLHDAIYQLKLPGLVLPRAFVPHMTVGRQPPADSLAVAFREAHEMPLSLSGVARVLSIYRINGDGLRTRELDMPFGGA